MKKPILSDEELKTLEDAKKLEPFLTKGQYKKLQKQIIKKLSKNK